MRIAVLGGGVMGETLASGMLRCLTPRPSVVVAEKRRERGEELRIRHGVDLASPEVAVADADVILLAVKPQDLGGLLDAIAGHVPPHALVISICAGITTGFIEDRLPGGVAVVRAMPNTPARVDRGTTGVSPGGACPPDALARAVVLLQSVGSVVEVPEAMQDAVTAVSGSGPAYVFYLAEAMIDGGLGLGLDPVTARRLVHQTLLGAAVLLDVSDETAEELRRNVTSPNGTTAAAISTMDQLGVRQAVVSAIAAAHDRSRELSGG